jgi:hypothetical protein
MLMWQFSHRRKKMAGEQKNPGEPGEPEKINDEVQLEKLVYHAQAVSKHIRDGDYIAAAFVIDTFPQGYNKSAFYAGLAVSLAGELDKAEQSKDGSKSHQAEVLKQLLGYCKRNCDYFSAGAADSAAES